MDDGVELSALQPSEKVRRRHDIGQLALGEKMTGWRGAAALSIVFGVVALRMG